MQRWQQATRGAIGWWPIKKDTPYKANSRAHHTYTSIPHPSWHGCITPRHATKRRIQYTIIVECSSHDASTSPPHIHRASGVAITRVRTPHVHYLVHECGPQCWRRVRFMLGRPRSKQLASRHGAPQRRRRAVQSSARARVEAPALKLSRC
jgi:hypothetical protein